MKSWKICLASLDLFFLAVICVSFTFHSPPKVQTVDHYVVRTVEKVLKVRSHTALSHSRTSQSVTFRPDGTVRSLHLNVQTDQIVRDQVSSLRNTSRTTLSLKDESKISLSRYEIGFTVPLFGSGWDVDLAARLGDLPLWAVLLISVPQKSVSAGLRAEF